MVATITSLPVELRISIYDLVLQSASIHSIRPQRRIGWNRPHADLSRPALLFDDESHPVLKALFTSKITRFDHHLVLARVLRQTRVMLVDHADLVALLRFCDSRGKSSAASKNFSMVIQSELRAIDFTDRLDDVVCQPGDLSKLIRGLKGLKKISLTSNHYARFSGSISEHIEFAQERALLDKHQNTKMGSKKSIDGDMHHLMGRMHLNSPVTDGSRMMVSPALAGYNRSVHVGDTWVVVDLSMLVWQHYLYTGAPYRDHWRSVKIETLLTEAETRSVEVVLGLRRIEFDPVFEGSPSRRVRTNRQSMMNGTFRAEMSTKDWWLRFSGRRSQDSGREYRVRQKRIFDEHVSQEGAGLVADR